MLGSYVTSSSRSEFGVSIEENAQRGYEPILVAKILAQSGNKLRRTAGTGEAASAQGR